MAHATMKPLNEKQRQLRDEKLRSWYRRNRHKPAGVPMITKGEVPRERSDDNPEPVP
jgi:hypothetical protein